MRFSINIPNLGDFADPQVVAEAARLAEEAGWDGLFIWDHLIGYNRDLVGEFAATNILLASAALATDRIRLGSQVTPVPRRRPRQLAREIATLDRLSGGRLVLGVGLGDPVENEYGRFGEPTDPRVLAGLLDEGLAVMTLLWSGEPVSFHGRYYTVDDVIMRPTPVQQPRVPIWIGGHWPHKPPARRAARWDGAVLTTGAWDQPPEPGVIAEMHAFIQAHRRGRRSRRPAVRPSRRRLDPGERGRRPQHPRTPRRRRRHLVGRTLPHRHPRMVRRGPSPHRTRTTRIELTRAQPRRHGDIGWSGVQPRCGLPRCASNAT